jgi:prepilin-type N-terminal cleavage/methylation domain-containing protein
MKRQAHNRQRNRGFTLVEVMAVAGIIGLMAAISVPGLQKARLTSQLQVCRSNLRLIEDAIDEVMMESNMVSTVQVTTEMVAPYLKVGAIENLSWPLEVVPPSDAIIQASDTNGLYVVINGRHISTGR